METGKGCIRLEKAEEAARRVCREEGFHVRKLLERLENDEFLFECWNGQVILVIGDTICPAPTGG